jgi:predicted DNA-binding transcriptional regulator AlpA
MHRENVITTPAIDPLLSDREVSALIGRARPTLQKDRLRGDGIPFVRIGRLVRYRRSDVERWFANQRAFTSTSEYGAKSGGRRSTQLAGDLTNSE